MQAESLARHCKTGRLQRSTQVRSFSPGKFLVDSVVVDVLGDKVMV